MSVADRSASEKAKQGGVWETIKVVIEALLIALVFRTFLFHPFNIPSGSMEPTLLIGDYLFVSKFSYGYSRYSFPVDLSFIHGRIWEGDGPKRGDIAVFRPPREPDTDYIKRVIGLPGDRIQVQDGVLYINDEPVKREPAGEWEGEDRFGTPPASRNTARRCRTASATSRSTWRERPGRQHPRLRGAAGPLLHDGRQPRQLAGQPLPQRAGRLRAGGESRRARGDHLLLRRRGAGLGVLEVAVVGPAGPHLRASS